MSSRIASVSDLGVVATLKRGVQISPQIVQGVGQDAVVDDVLDGQRYDDAARWSRA